MIQSSTMNTTHKLSSTFLITSSTFYTLPIIARDALIHWVLNIHTFGVNTSRFLWWTAVSSRMSSLYPDPWLSCRLTLSSLANLIVFEYFYEVIYPTHISLQFPSFHIVNTSNNVVSLPSPSNNSWGILACKDLQIRKVNTIFTFTSNVTFWFKAYHT